MKKRKSVSYAKYGYLFSIPFILAYIAFNLYPTIYTILLGFTDSKGLGNDKFNFLKSADLFKNFETILKNKSFTLSIQNTLVIFILNFIPQLALALLLTAWFTSPRCKIKGQGFFKVMFYMPNIITAATIAMLFNVLFGYPTGPINDLVVSLGIKSEPYYFSQNGYWAKGIVAFIQFWMWYGYTAIIFISGVLGINPEIFEAAEIDGANSRQTFWKITLPNLKSIMLFMLVTSLIGGLGMYDIPRMFLNGGPSNKTLTAAVFIYNQAFSGSYLYARAAAASLIVFVIIIILSAIVFYMMRDRDAIKQKKLDKAAEKQRLKELKSKGAA